jgi:hypothetical protein
MRITSHRGPAPLQSRIVVFLIHSLPPQATIIVRHRLQRRAYEHAITKAAIPQQA